MSFEVINWLGILTAAIGGFVFSAIYHGLLSKPWVAAVGILELPKQSPGSFIITFISQLAMAAMLYGLVGHIGEVNLRRAVISALLVWIGFVVTAIIVNHQFQGGRWSLTMIEAGHWLGVMLVMAVVLGLFGAA